MAACAWAGLAFGCAPGTDDLVGAWTEMSIPPQYAAQGVTSMHHTLTIEEDGRYSDRIASIFGNAPVAAPIYGCTMVVYENGKWSDRGTKDQITFWPTVRNAAVMGCHDPTSDKPRLEVPLLDEEMVQHFRYTVEGNVITFFDPVSNNAYRFSR